MNVLPFKIDISERVLADLRSRLINTRWPDEVKDSGWAYGTNLSYLKELTSYWTREYDWRKQERMLNQFPHFQSEVSGLRIHYIHQKGKGPRPLPIVLTHGWPSSFAEMLKIIPLLTDPASYGGDPEDSFDVVVPSLPGYGFSERPPQKGMSAYAIADLWNELMQGLGYSRFVAQGGDWGSYVSSRLAFRYPQNVIGLHLSFIPGAFIPYLGVDAKPLSKIEKDLLIHRDSWLQEEGGYGHIHRTRPQTIAFMLNDSPVGLAAWIVEKFRSWSDCEGQLEGRFSKDELLTNIMLYWVTETGGSSVRLYYETQQDPWIFNKGDRISVPTAVTIFPRELNRPPRDWVERLYNVAQWTEAPLGGHFAAAEAPAFLAQEIRTFFRRFRK